MLALVPKIILLGVLLGVHLGLSCIVSVLLDLFGLELPICI